MNIVLTRPYEDSFELKKYIESASEHQCFIHPVMEIHTLKKPVDLPEDSIIAITSINGIRALAQNTRNRDYHIIAVGNQSAAEAQNLGFTNVASAVTSSGISASEKNLIKYIRENIAPRAVINHISAEITKGGLKKCLKEDGYRYNRVVLYNAKPVDLGYSFIENVREEFFQAYTFYSPRSAALFAKQILQNGLAPFLHRAVAFCFSENVICGLSGLNFRTIYIPEVTNSENFVNLIRNQNL